MNGICNYTGKQRSLLQATSCSLVLWGEAGAAGLSQKQEGSSIYFKERGDIKHCRRDKKQGMCPETTSRKPYSKPATRKGMTVLEIELSEGQSLLMRPDSCRWLMAAALITEAENMGEHEEILPLQQPVGSVHNYCQHPVLHDAPQLQASNWVNMLRNWKKKADGQETPMPRVRKWIHWLVSQWTQHQLCVQERAGIHCGKLISPEQPLLLIDSRGTY